MTDPALQTLLQPRSIGIIGASDNPNKVGGRPIAFLRRYGYRGSIFPINPARSEVQGITAFPELAATPSAPEVVIIAVPAEATPAAVAACAARGVKAAIVLSSGFGETGPDGRAVQDAMVATAKRHGMRLIGPNSQGLANIGCGAVMSFSTMFVETEARDGPVAIVSQSGAISVVPYGILRRRGFGVRHLHAVGNEADITVAELATAVAADPDVGVLLLYLESLPDPAQLAHCAELARARDLPIVALKSGRTASGLPLRIPAPWRPKTWWWMPSSNNTASSAPTTSRTGSARFPCTFTNFGRPAGVWW
jgi:acyl-CoA synthetase (NDP forming)